MVIASRRLALALVLALATAPIVAHDLPASDHPGWVHFHVKGHVRTEGGLAISDVNVFYGAGLGTDRATVGRFQIGACKLEVPPVRTASDGSYDLVVYHELPTCERQVKEAVRVSLAATKEGYSFGRPRGI
jgi:hypothetical protein